MLNFGGGNGGLEFIGPSSKTFLGFYTGILASHSAYWSFSIGFLTSGLLTEHFCYKTFGYCLF